MRLTRENFGRYIANLRRNKNLSQVDLAKQLDMTQAQVCNIEKGLYFPSADTLVKLSVFFNITLDELCGISRENRITVILGNVESEKKFLSMMVRHHNKTLEYASLSEKEEPEEAAISYREIFEYLQLASEKYMRGIEPILNRKLSRYKLKER